MISKLFSHVKSLKRTLTLIVLLSWFIPTVVLGVFMGTRFFDSLREKTEAAIASVAQQAQVLLLSNIEYVIGLAKNITYDGDLTEAYAQYASGVSRYQDYLRVTRNYLERKFSREKMNTFSMFMALSEPDQLIYNTQGYFEAMAFEQEALTQVLALCETLDTRTYFYAYGDKLCLVRNLYNTRLERYGIFIMGIDPVILLEPIYSATSALEATWGIRLDSFSAGGYFEEAGIGLHEYSDALCYTAQVETYDYSLRLQVRTQTDKVYAEMTSLRRLTTLLLLLMIPLLTLILLFVQKRIVKPIAILSRASSRIQNGELGVIVPMHGEDELGRLGSAFSAMSLQIKELVDKSYKEEIALRDARIQAMQSRINPHFLNNALEIINWQARMDNNACISGMVEALSVLLNASLDRSDHHLATLKEELKLADSYFLFIRLRFGDKITISQNVDEAALNAPVPRLAVQTLIENAVEYGLTPNGGGHIMLSTTQGDALSIKVINDGTVLSDADIERVEGIMRSETPQSGHLGLRNIWQRLVLLFGSRANLTIARDENDDTVVEITIAKEA